MARATVTSDPRIQRLRDEIAARDRAVLAAVNDRLRLVAELRKHKEESGLAFVDPEQERRLLDRLVTGNDGPLSDDAVRELFEEILRLTKREVQ
jgi:chorismate mutase